MATFVSFATCHHCPVVSSRRGLIYRDSLSALSRNLTGPGCPHRPPGPQLQGLCLHNRHHCRLNRPDLPESIALTRSKPSDSMKHLVLAHLRKLLTLSPAHEGLHLPADLQPAAEEPGAMMTMRKRRRRTELS